MLAHPLPYYSPAGWYSRAEPLHYKLPYEVLDDKFVFGLETHSMVVIGVTFALFKPNVAIDVTGRVLTLKQVDWNALAEIANRTTGLPRTGRFRTWEIDHDFTCMPTEVIHVSGPNGSRVFTVDGWTGERAKLRFPISNITYLPDSLHLLLKYASEGWNDSEYWRHGRNEVFLANVKKVFRDETNDAQHSLNDLD